MSKFRLSILDDWRDGVINTRTANVLHRDLVGFEEMFNGKPPLAEFARHCLSIRGCGANTFKDLLEMGVRRGAFTQTAVAEWREDPRSIWEQLEDLGL
jgi:hypothetical protein